MISTALQRRIWMGSEHLQLFPNMYTVFVGPAGVGKGMVAGQIKAILTHNKLKRVADSSLPEDTLDDQGNPDPKAAMRNAMLAAKNLRIPLGPNTCTFEALCQILGKSAQSYTHAPDPSQPTKMKVEFHSSLGLHLSELGSLIRKHHEDIPVLLCDLYDCVDPFEYRTKHQGHDFIRKPCLNLLACCTPDFLKRVFSTSLLAEGFASRTVFAVAHKNLFDRFEPPNFTEDQKKERELLVDHILKLTKLTGKLTFSPEAKELVRQWWEDPDRNKKRANPDPRLDPYYARKNITLQKLCMAAHCGESLEPVIQESTVLECMSFLHKTEEIMHSALSVDVKNPLAEVTEAVRRYIEVNGEVTRKKLMGTFFDRLPVPSEDLSSIITFLKDQDKIKENGVPNTYIYNR